MKHCLNEYIYYLSSWYLKIVPCYSGSFIIIIVTNNNNNNSSFAYLCPEHTHVYHIMYLQYVHIFT